MTGKITRARIKREKWRVERDRASITYKDRRQPRTEIEKNWPRKVKSLFTTICSGHSKEIDTAAG